MAKGSYFPGLNIGGFSAPTPVNPLAGAERALSELMAQKERQEQMAWEKQKFGLTFGLQKDQFGFQQQQHADNFGLQRDQFGLSKRSADQTYESNKQAQDTQRQAGQAYQTGGYQAAADVYGGAGNIDAAGKADEQGRKRIAAATGVIESMAPVLQNIKTPEQWEKFRGEVARRGGSIPDGFTADDYRSMVDGQLEHLRKTKEASGSTAKTDPQQAFAIKYAEKAPDLYNEAGKAYSDAQSSLRNVSDMELLSKHATTGWGAEGINQLRRFANQIGIAPESINNATAATEAFRALSQKFVLSEAQKLKPLSNSDLDFVQKGVATIASDPSAMPVILPALRAEAQRVSRAQQLAMEALKRGTPPNYQAIEAQVDQEIPSAIRQLYANKPPPGTPAQQAATAVQGATQPAQPPPAAVEHLRKNPALAREFDAKYGAGAAERAMGAQR